MVVRDQTVCHVSSSRFLLGLSLEHSVAHGVTSRCEHQCLHTEIALRHRDVNYKGVTVTLKDFRSMFIVLAQRKCLIHRLTGQIRQKCSCFLPTTQVRAALLPPSRLQLDGIGLSFSLHNSTVVSEGEHCLKNNGLKIFFQKTQKKKKITSR